MIEYVNKIELKSLKKKVILVALAPVTAPHLEHR